jgi:predicted Zn-dependent peptidase
MGSARRLEAVIGREQSWIRLGTAFGCADADGPPSTSRLSSSPTAWPSELRERQGLAYSIGASARPPGRRAWLVASMGTRPANLERAEHGLEGEIRKLGTSPITGEEITKVVKSHTGRMRMRQVTRINQAQALCLDALAGRELGSGFRDLESLSAVTPDGVRRVASGYPSAVPPVSAIATRTGRWG